MLIRTLEGEMRADPGDWIIRGVQGEFYPCKPDIFEATYEPAEPAPGSPVEPETPAPSEPTAAAWDEPEPGDWQVRVDASRMPAEHFDALFDLLAGAWHGWARARDGRDPSCSATGDQMILEAFAVPRDTAGRKLLDLSGTDDENRAVLCNWTDNELAKWCDLHADPADTDRRWLHIRSLVFAERDHRIANEPTAAEWEATGATWDTLYRQWVWGNNPPSGWAWTSPGEGWSFNDEPGTWRVQIIGFNNGSPFACSSAREAWEFVVACQVAALGLTPSGDER
jgi:hypothetical protein